MSFWQEVTLAPEDESDMEDEMIEVCSIRADSTLREMESSEPKEVTEVSVEIQDESSCCSCSELVDVQLSVPPREDIEKASWQALPTSCVWAAN